MFWSNSNPVTKWFTTFSEKKSPERISLSRTVLRDADFYVVYIREGDTENGYLFEEMDGNELVVKQYDVSRESFTIPARLNVADVLPEQVYGTHYYLGYRIDFASLEHLETVNNNKVLCGIRKERNLEEKQQLGYNTEEQHVKDRMDVLSAVIELYVKDGRPCGLSKIATRIHTFRWVEHPKKDIIKRELSLVLDSFVLGGELNGGELAGFFPTGKAFTTQGEYVLHTRRYLENRKLQSKVLWATAFAAIAAAGSAVAALFPLFHAK